MKPRRRGPSIVARRHVQATYRAWARRAGWTAEDEAWVGTLRGAVARVAPHLEDDVPDEVLLRITLNVPREPATLTSAEDAEELGPLFADGTLVRLEWTAEHLDLRFLPLTEPDVVVATGEAALGALHAAESPYR